MTQFTRVNLLTLPATIVLLITIILMPCITQAGVDDIFMGEFRLITDDVPNPPLERTAHGTATFALAFASDVGGINFQASDKTARHEDKPPLYYDESAPDGKRLHILIDGTDRIASLYDWQLKPIVSFAESPYTAVVSLFGPGAERDRYFYIQYHAAFQDTLLGLRLLQADMFLMDPKQLRQMPRSGSRDILGPGESPPSEKASAKAATEIVSLLQQKPAGSWILTDVEAIDTPYYFFWHGEPDEMALMTKLLQWRAEHPSASRLATEQALRDMLSDRQLIPDKHYTDLMRTKYDLYLAASRPVFRAALYVQRYAAFFRTIKRDNPVLWKTFASSVQRTARLETFRTPTRLERKPASIAAD